MNRLQRATCRFLIAVLALGWAASFATAQEVGVTAKVDSTRYRVGDIITVHVDARVPADIASIAPSVKDSAGPFEIVKLDRQGNEPHWTLQLMTLDSGNTFIPPIEFLYSRTSDTTKRAAYSNPLPLTIGGVAIDPQGEIKDIKPPVSAPWLFEDFLPYILALVVLAASGGAFSYYWRKKKEKEASFVPARSKIPPHMEALSALRLVEDKHLWEQGRVKEYYSEITEIIRTFFERRWEIIALEMTSDEILRQMKGIAEVERVWNEMTGLFETADLVKFAKYQPTPSDHANELQWAYEIVRAMIPVPKTVEEEREQAEVTADVR